MDVFLVNMLLIERSEGVGYSRAVAMLFVPVETGYSTAFLATFGASVFL